MYIKFCVNLCRKLEISTDRPLVVSKLVTYEVDIAFVFASAAKKNISNSSLAKQWQHIYTNVIRDFSE